MQKVRVCLYLTSTTRIKHKVVCLYLTSMQEFNIYYAKSSCVFIFNVNYKNLTYIMQKVQKVCVCLYLTSTTRI